jgi:hypothetical protein
VWKLERLETEAESNNDDYQIILIGFVEVESGLRIALPKRLYGGGNKVTLPANPLGVEYMVD